VLFFATEAPEMQNFTGELFALATALCWTVTALSFESAGKRVGSLAVNLIRLLMALVLITIYTSIVRGTAWPSDATPEQWMYLGLSGLVGFVIGDLFLFQAFVVVGARIAMLVYSSVPILTALLGWVFLGENLTLLQIFGITLTVSGIGVVVLDREEGGGRPKHIVAGAVLALLGALGQAVGLILSKAGVGNYDAFAGNQIRIYAGVVGFIIVFFFLRRWPKFFAAFRDRNAMGKISLGAVFGPFLGVSFSLLAVKFTLAGVAATIIALVPVLIIPPAVIINKEKVNWKEVAGALVAVSGVAIMFL
jgi:drug/metabolite transporter (DMT)-like permease